MKRTTNLLRRLQKAIRRSPHRRTYRPLVERLETRLAPANVDVLSFHNDLSLSGANLQETQLTYANVNPTQFGKLFSQPVDGYVYAEPLYKANLPVPGQGTHNVAFVATEHDSVYAFDADSNAGANANPLWFHSFLDPANAITTVPSPSVVSNSDIVPEIGITGTPVIDGSTNTLYVVAVTQEIRSGVTHYVQKLHALDITTGNERTAAYTLGDAVQGGAEGGWTNVSDISVSGVGDGSGGGVIRFNAARENNRSALQLAGGLVYAAFASHSDFRPYTGWVLGFNAQTLQPVKVFNTSPSSGGNGMWQSGGPVSADSQGNLYFALGNGFSTNGPITGVTVVNPGSGYTSAPTVTISGGGGTGATAVATVSGGMVTGVTITSSGSNYSTAATVTFSGGGATTQATGYLNSTGWAFNPPSGNWSESVLKLSATGQLTVTDYFTPFEWRTLDGQDADLGSGGVMLLPNSVGSAAHPHLMVELGKSGKLYLLDRDNMGHNVPPPGPDNVVQVVTAGQHGVWGNPTFFQVNPTTGIIYYHGSGDVMRGYTITNGHIDDAHVMVSPQSTFSNFPGTQPVISANGIANPTNPTDGIVWELQVDNFGGGTPMGNRPLTGPAFLRALKATDLTTVLYDSKSNAVGQRDLFGEPIKFTVPTVTNGHVLVGQARTFSVFGLFPQATAVPAAPSNLAAVVQAGTQGPQIQLSWTNPPPNPGHDPTGIKILRSTDGSNFSLVTTVFRLNTTFADLGPFDYNQPYFYKVVATNQLGDSPPSGTINVTIVIAPATLTLTGTGASSIGLSWTAVANDHYTIERSADGTTFASIATVPAVQTSYTDTGLAPGQYAYRIHAFNVSPNGDSLSGVQGAWVGPVVDHSTPSLAGFANATDLTVNGSAFVSPSEHVIRLTNANNQTGSVFSNTRFMVGSFTTTFDVRLHEGTQPNYADGFAFVLQANSPTTLGQTAEGIGYRGIGNSVALVFSTYPHVGDPSSSSVGLALNGAAPFQSVDTTPSGLLLNSQDIKQIDLSYDGTTLTVRVQDIVQPQLIFTTSFTVNLSQFLGSDTAYVGFTGASGSNFFWELEDVVDWRFTSQVTVPGAPTNLRETAFTSSAVDLAWNSNSYNETGFQVERSTDGTNFNPIATTTGTSYEDAEVIPSIPYYYRVQALGAGGNSPDSGALRASLPSPVLNQDQDIGTPGDPAIPGSATFAGGSMGAYAISASGSDIWDVTDHFHYVYRPLLGDGEISARVVSVGPGGFSTKAGVMIRETLAANAKKAFMLEFPVPHNQPAFNWRTTTGGASMETAGPGNLPAPIWVRLVRSGRNFSGYYALDTGGGTHGPWNLVDTEMISMSPNVYVGLAADGNTNAATVTSTFDNVQILPSVPTTSHLDVSVPRGATNPGTPVQVTVAALDTYNNTVSGYRGTVHFTSSDPQVTLPNYTFTAADNGRHTFTVLLGTLGRQTLTVTDLATPAIVGGTVVTVMTAPVASSLLVAGFPASINGGVAGSFTVTARDAMGNTLTGYRGTVQFVSSDPQAQLQGAYTFTAADNGVHTFTATLNTIGTQSITAFDATVRIAGTQSGIQVSRPAPPAVIGTTVSPIASVTFGAVPRFDGTDDYIQAPSSLVVGGAITVEAWVKSANVFANWARVIDFANGPNLDNIILGWMANSGRLYFETYRNGQTIALATPTVFPQNQWVHVAAVNDGNGAGSIYINGVLVITGPQIVPATVVRTQQYVGRSNYPADAFFSGSIEDLHIWNSARSASQIHTDMNQVTGNEPGLVLDYPLDEGSGTTAYDRTAGRYNGTLLSTTTGDQPAWIADPGPGSGRVVATFTSANPSATAANFTAMITWGDGHQSPGTITPNGQGGWSVSGSNAYAQPGTYPISVVVTDQFTSTGTGHGTANVLAPVTQFFVTGFPSSIAAGTASTFTVTAQDDLGRTFTGYRGTVHFTSSDPLAALPADYTFTAADNGRAIFGAALFTVGRQSITATDTSSETLTGTQANILVNPRSFTVTDFPAQVAAGDEHTFTVTARDFFGNPVPAYLGTVRFTSSDPHAILPGDYTFTADDAGTHIFTATLVTAGIQSITVADTLTPAQSRGTQSGIVVNPAAASQFILTGFPSSTQAGAPHDLTVTAEDPYGNIATGYSGTVTFSSNDPQAGLPADYTFDPNSDAGVHTFSITLKTAGTRSITVADNANSLVATQEGIHVTPGVAVSFQVIVLGNPVAGTPADVFVTAVDAYGNTGAIYTGTVHVSSDDFDGFDYTFRPDDHGSHVFSVTFRTHGSHFIRVEDNSDPTIFGEQDDILVA
jgi:hypothetical protein